MDGLTTQPENAITLSRGDIANFEQVLKELPQIDLSMFHHFADFLYARQMDIPMGVALVGKIHKVGHLCFLVKGDISVATEKGVERLKAPMIFASNPGAKRVMYAHEDSTFVTVHMNPFNEKDVGVLEKGLVTEDFDDPKLVEALAASLKGV